MSPKSVAGRAECGASTVEFIIVGLLFLGLLGGLFEMAYLYRTKITLNRVAMEAARSGALNNALVSKMNDAVERGMVPLYMSADRSKTGLATALVKAKGVGAALSGFGRLVQIVSPTREVFELFKTEQFVKTTLDESTRKQFVIPNDNLNVRDRTLKSFTANGQAAQINLQDANLLRIRAWWCHELVVPGLDRVVHSIVSGSVMGIGIPASTEQLACDAVAAARGAASGGSRYAIPVSSHALVRMQSPIVYHEGNLPG